MTKKFYEYLTRDWWETGSFKENFKLFDTSYELLKAVFARGKQNLIDESSQRGNKIFASVLEEYERECESIYAMVEELDINKKFIFYAVTLCASHHEPPKFSVVVTMIFDALLQTKVRTESYGLDPESLKIVAQAKVKRRTNALFVISIILMSASRIKPAGQVKSAPLETLLSAELSLNNRWPDSQANDELKSVCECACDCKYPTDQAYCGICQYFCERVESTTAADEEDKTEGSRSDAGVVYDPAGETVESFDPGATTRELIERVIDDAGLIDHIFVPMPTAWLKLRPSIVNGELTIVTTPAESAIIDQFIDTHQYLQRSFTRIGRTMSTAQLERICARLMSEQPTVRQIMAAALELFIFSDNDIPQECIFVGRKPPVDGWLEILDGLSSQLRRRIGDEICKSEVAYGKFQSWHKDEKIAWLINLGVQADQLSLFL